MVSLSLDARQYPPSTLRVSKVLPDPLVVVWSSAFEQIGGDASSPTVQFWQSSHEGHPLHMLS